MTALRYLLGTPAYWRRKRAVLSEADVRRLLAAQLPNVDPRPLRADPLDDPPFYRRHTVRVVNGVRVLGQPPDPPTPADGGGSCQDGPSDRGAL